MGISAVSRTQYDEENMTATLRVTKQSVNSSETSEFVLESFNAHGVSDPTKWFGGMVSPHLRVAQQDFATAILTVVKLASLSQQIRLNSVVLQSVEK